MKQNQQGFLIVEVLLLILVIAVLGLGGWYVWHSNHKSSTPTQATNSPTDTSTSENSTKYLTITSQKVRLPLTSELSGLSAGSVEDSGYSTADKSVTVTASELDKDWTCEADANGSKGIIGTISITTQAKRSGPGDPAVTKKLGETTYGFEPGGSNCTSSSKYSDLVSAFEKQFTSLVSY